MATDLGCRALESLVEDLNNQAGTSVEDYVNIAKELATRATFMMETIRQVEKEDLSGERYGCHVFTQNLLNRLSDEDICKLAREKMGSADKFSVQRVFEELARRLTARRDQIRARESGVGDVVFVQPGANDTKGKTPIAEMHDLHIVNYMKRYFLWNTSDNRRCMAVLRELVMRFKEDFEEKEAAKTAKEQAEEIDAKLSARKTYSDKVRQAYTWGSDEESEKKGPYSPSAFDGRGSEIDIETSTLNFYAGEGYRKAVIAMLEYAEDFIPMDDYLQMKSRALEAMISRETDGK